MDKKLKIVSFLKEKDHELWKKIINEWNKYFNVKVKLETIDKFSNYKNRRIDILFLDHSMMKSFQYKLYEVYKQKEKHFKYIIVKQKRTINDFKIYKRLVDDIVYLDDIKLVKWKTISLLRRYWDIYSLPTTIIYKNIIADFIEKEVLLNNNKVILTDKEFSMLKLFLKNIGVSFQKNELFKNIWKVDDQDNTRVVDQILFKLKKKIGVEYFVISRKNGVIFK